MARTDNWEYAGPGRLRNTVTGDIKDIVYERDGIVFDTVRFAAGLQTTSPQQIFTNLSSKFVGMDTNLTVPGKVPFSQTLELHRIGVNLVSIGGTEALPTDIRLALENLMLTFKVDKTELAAAPVLLYQSGYGVAGQTNKSGQGIVNNGTPSTAAAMDLLEPVLITQEHTLSGNFTFADRSWATGWVQPTTTNDIAVRIYLIGRLIDPAFI